MDPITIALLGIGGGIISALGAAGAVAAPVLGAATLAGPVTTALVALGAPAATLSAAGSAAPVGIIATNPHAATGAQNGINDALNSAKAGFAGSVNNLQIPGVPPLHFN